MCLWGNALRSSQTASRCWCDGWTAPWLEADVRITCFGSEILYIHIYIYIHCISLYTVIETQRSRAQSVAARSCITWLAVNLRPEHGPLEGSSRLLWYRFAPSQNIAGNPDDFPQKQKVTGQYTTGPLGKCTVYELFSMLQCWSLHLVML